MLPVMNTMHAAAMERFLPSVSDTLPAINPPPAATRFSDDTMIPCGESRAAEGFSFSFLLLSLLLPLFLLLLVAGVMVVVVLVRVVAVVMVVV